MAFEWPETGNERKLLFYKWIQFVKAYELGWEMNRLIIPAQYRHYRACIGILQFDMLSLREIFGV